MKVKLSKDGRTKNILRHPHRHLKVKVISGSPSVCFIGNGGKFTEPLVERGYDDDISKYMSFYFCSKIESELDYELS